MLIVCFFLHIKSLPNLLFGVLCLPGDQRHPFAQPTINPLACWICWAGLLGRVVFPPWNEGPNSGSYIRNQWTKMDRNGWTIIDLYMVDDHYTYFWGQESLRRKIVALIVNIRVQNTVLGCSLKSDRMISVHFQGKPLNITVLQVYVPTSNAKEAEVEWFYEDLQDFPELTP